MVKIQQLRKGSISPVHIITLNKEVISATNWAVGDSIEEIVLNKNEVLLKKNE